MAALKEIRHSAHLPATLAHYAYEHQRARERKSSGRAALRPEKFGGLFVVLSEMSGEGEILLSGVGLWSSAITPLTGTSHLRYLKDDKEIFTIVPSAADR